MQAEDRSSWRVAIRESVKIFEQNLAEIAKEKHNQGHRNNFLDLMQVLITLHNVMCVVESVVSCWTYTVI